MSDLFRAPDLEIEKKGGPKLAFCAWCGQPFMPRRETEIYCRPSCRDHTTPKAGSEQLPKLF